MAGAALHLADEARSADEDGACAWHSACSSWRAALDRACATAKRCELREALQDDAKSPRFLRTAHGVGYAFSSPASAEEGPPSGAQSSGAPLPFSYRLLYDDREISLQPGGNLLSRVDDGVVWIDSPSVSRRHARITVTEGGATLERLGSKNGTFLRGARLSAPAALADGDEFRLGRVAITLRIRPLDVTTR